MNFTPEKRPSLYCVKLWKQEEIFWHSILAGCLQCTTQATRCCIISKAHVRLLKSTTLHGRSLSRTFRTPGQILNAIPVELNISQCGGHAVKILRNPANEGFRDHIADESRQQGDRLASLTVSAYNLASSIYRIQYSAHHTSIQPTSSG